MSALFYILALGLRSFSQTEVLKLAEWINQMASDDDKNFLAAVPVASLCVTLASIIMVASAEFANSLIEFLIYLIYAWVIIHLLIGVVRSIYAMFMWSIYGWRTGNWNIYNKD